MKNLLLIMIMCFALVLGAEAQNTRVYSTGDVGLSGADTSFVLSVASFPKNVNGLAIEAIYKKMDGTAENLAAVKLYNSVTGEALDIGGNPIFVDSLNYATGDGELYTEFAKIDFYSSALKILIDRPAGASDTSRVKVNIWAIENN